MAGMVGVAVMPSMPPNKKKPKTPAASSERTLTLRWVMSRRTKESMGSSVNIYKISMGMCVARLDIYYIKGCLLIPLLGSFWGLGPLPCDQFDRRQKKEGPRTASPSSPGRAAEFSSRPAVHPPVSGFRVVREDWHPSSQERPRDDDSAAISLQGGVATVTVQRGRPTDANGGGGFGFVLGATSVEVGRHVVTAVTPEVGLLEQNIHRKM